MGSLNKKVSLQTFNVWGELTVDGAKALYNVLPCTIVCPMTLNIHGKVTDDFLRCTAGHVDKQKPLCPITINTWDQLTNEGKVLFKELELAKNPAVTLNVCEVHVPSGESSDNEVESIDNPTALIALLESAEDTGNRNVRVIMNVQNDDSTCDDSGRSWNDSRLLGLLRNCSLNYLTFTINNFSPRKIGLLSVSLARCLESCISLKSLTLTLNEYNDDWENFYGTIMYEGLRLNTSLISLTLTLNIYTRVVSYKKFEYNLSPIISLNSFILTINVFSGRGNWGLSSCVLFCNSKSLNTFNLTLNNWDGVIVHRLFKFLDTVMEVNLSRTLRLKINDMRFRNADYPEYDFSKLVVKRPSLELIEVTICRYGVVGSWQETLKWEKQ